MCRILSLQTLLKLWFEFQPSGLLKVLAKSDVEYHIIFNFSKKTSFNVAK